MSSVKIKSGDTAIEFTNPTGEPLAIDGVTLDLTGATILFLLKLTEAPYTAYSLTAAADGNPTAGNVVYEVVYSKIVDDLVNNAGESVAKIVNLPYAITDPGDGSTELTQVYPNSLINMRDQVIDVVGQISTKLPLWKIGRAHV